jgi:metal-responsive CopG/Arc/MetJ family transcriptional regulator
MSHSVEVSDGLYSRLEDRLEESDYRHEPNMVREALEEYLRRNSTTEQRLEDMENRLRNMEELLRKRGRR